MKPEKRCGSNMKWNKKIEGALQKLLLEITISFSQAFDEIKSYSIVCFLLLL